jgi:hypothetical protein
MVTEQEATRMFERLQERVAKLEHDNKKLKQETEWLIEEYRKRGHPIPISLDRD